MSAPALLDGVACSAVEAMQRGLAYGDGIFETMRARDGAIALWRAHVVRLGLGCQSLGLDVPSEEVLLDERQRMLRACPDNVLKLLLWRRASGPGYDPAGERATHRCWIASPLPVVDQAPLRVRWCDLRIARQPRLAGLKTLNRLEMVLARSEWIGNEWDEGLLCDDAGHVVSAVSGNLFALIEGRLVTPAIDQCGVAGVMRAWLLEQAIPTGSIEVRAILRAELELAREMFVTNAVRGIRAIGSLGTQRCSSGEATASWIARARAAGLMDPASDPQ